MADIIRNENEEKKIKVKAPVTAKKNKQHQTSNSVTSAVADLKFLQVGDLDLVLFILFCRYWRLDFYFFLFIFISYSISHRMMFKFN